MLHERPLLQFDSSFTSTVGQSLDPAMINISVPVEDCRSDILLGSIFGKNLSDFLGRVHGQTDGFALKSLGRCGSQSRAGLIIDQLGIDVLVGTKDNQARPFGSAENLLPDPDLSFFPRLLFSQFHGSTYFFPDLPALRRICSSTYLIPLPLYGSGGRTRLIRAATSPTNCLSHPAILSLFPSAEASIPAGTGKFTGWEYP